jgi:hypothetical protein
MNKQFKFVNVAGSAFNKFPDRLMNQEYNVNVSAPAAQAPTSAVTKN